MTVFDIKNYFLNNNYSLVEVAKRKAVKYEEKEVPKEYDGDFEYFNDKHDELCLKHRNQFVAIKNEQVYSTKDPLKLLEIPNETKSTQGIQL